MRSERGTARGDLTRRRIIDAARRVFEQHGYLDIGVDEIVKEAGVARGSFYTYFTSKLDVFGEIAREVAAAVDQSIQRPDTERQLNPVEAVIRSNERYVDTYRQNAHMYALLEQLSHIDEDLHNEWRERRYGHIDRIASSIKRWQSRGFADPDIDPASTAAALLAMTGHLCGWMFVDDDSRHDEESTTITINEIWLRTLGLRRRPSKRWLEATSGSR